MTDDPQISRPRPAIIGRHPLIVFFVLAYAISWGSYFALAGPAMFPFGSIIAAIIVTALADGRAGLGDLLSRCGRWRVAGWWYLAAILVPVAIGVAAIYLNVAFGSALPPKSGGSWYEVLLILPMAIIDAPLWEESGWRGFAMPRFDARRSRLLNTLILGLLLAGWHLPLALAAGAVAFPYVITCILSAFVTNWIYYNSHQSAFLAMLYHGAANAIGLTFFQAYTGTDQLRLFWLLAATNLFAAVVIVSVNWMFWLTPDEPSVPFRADA
jgi:uncharacterized protein